MDRRSAYGSGMAKRTLDVVGAAAGLVFLSPILLAVSVGSLVALGRPILFFQIRPGLGGKPFRLVKFRTMIEIETADDAPRPDSERLTKWGSLLRGLSLDELPEFWNVLRGEMSLVGPRPLLMDYLPLYSDQQLRRHEVRPGITGWAQVNGRNALSWEQKFELDVWYVENVSLALDLKILWRTFASVVRRDGISAAGEATMPKFRGTTE